MSDKLKKGEITLKEVYQITVDYYTKFKSTVNLKALPYILKNIVAKAQGELQYDAEKLEWTGSNKALRIEFIVQTKDRVATKNKATFEFFGRVITNANSKENLSNQFGNKFIDYIYF